MLTVARRQVPHRPCHHDPDGSPCARPWAIGEICHLISSHLISSHRIASCCWFDLSLETIAAAAEPPSSYRVPPYCRPPVRPAVHRHCQIAGALLAASCWRWPVKQHPPPSGTTAAHGISDAIFPSQIPWPEIVQVTPQRSAANISDPLTQPHQFRTHEVTALHRLSSPAREPPRHVPRPTQGFGSVSLAHGSLPFVSFVLFFGTHCLSTTFCSTKPLASCHWAPGHTLPSPIRGVLRTGRFSSTAMDPV